MPPKHKISVGSYSVGLTFAFKYCIYFVHINGGIFNFKLACLNMQWKGPLLSVLTKCVVNITATHILWC